MEQQVLDLLAATLEPAANIRNDAELHLKQLYTNPQLPISLISIASHNSVSIALRQAALLSLKTLVLKTWSPSLDEFSGEVLIDDATKEQLRQSMLSIATSGEEERKIMGAASYVVSKIASADFPEQWPTLLPTLLRLISQTDGAQLHGALVVLGNLVEDGFDEEQFSQTAVDLVKCIYDVAVDRGKKYTTRALAVSIFRACFDTMEMVYQTHKSSVNQFMQEASDAWSPFFLDVLKMPLPYLPSEDEEKQGGPAVLDWRGVITLKTQVVKALDKIQNMFPQLLNTHSLHLFSTIWEGLQSHLGPYHTLYVNENRQSRLEDADRLPYTLDFLVIEELDYIQTLLNTLPVRREMEAQVAPEVMSNGTQSGAWITQVVTILVGYAQITQEDEALWDFDVNVFLSEETSETANYSPRNACSNFVTKLCRWPVVDSLLTYTKTIFDNSASTPKLKEAVLYICKQILDEFECCGKDIGPATANAYLDYVQVSMQDTRGFVVAGKLTTLTGSTLSALVPDFAQQTLNAIANESSDVVKVSCVRVLQEYLKALPSSRAREFQVQTVAAISGYLSSQDLTDIKESEDLLDTLVETLRDAIMADPSLCLDHPALDVLFTLASYGASSFQTSMLVNESFESITTSMAKKGPDAYAQLCTKVLPTLTGALDVGDMTAEDALSDMAVTLLSSLAENGPEPLPGGFVSTVMPKLYRLIFSGVEFTLHQSATITIKHILAHDPAQIFSWHDPETGKGGLEIILLIIDRLLGPSVDDASAAEVGGLAVELVEKVGAEELGPYLMQLLRVVAIRLSTAEHASFIQNLILVFARLSLTNAQEILDFLAQVQVEGPAGGSGLEVVMKKWLENSVNFSGYDAIRQNVTALTNIYKLHDERLSNILIRGDLVVPNSSRIKTRSLAKKEPDQYTMVPVSLKLVKVLIQELSNPASPTSLGTQNGNADSDDDGDGEWEDDAVLDLGNPTTRSELMGYMDESRWNTRQWDDDTQRYLVDFFKHISTEPYFQNLYHSLNDTEKEKLQRMEQEPQ